MAFVAYANASRWVARARWIAPHLALGQQGAGVDDLARRTSLVDSINYGQVVSFGGRKWRPSAELGPDFEDDPGNPKWVVRAGVTLLSLK